MNKLTGVTIMPLKIVFNEIGISATLKTSYVVTPTTGSFESVRYFSSSPAVNRRIYTGERYGVESADELRKMVENEKRGNFRKLDIGLPKQFYREREKRSDRIVIKAAPR